MNPERWISIPEVASYLGISKETIYRKLKSKTIPAYKVGKQWRFKISEIDSWVRGEPQ